MHVTYLNGSALVTIEHIDKYLVWKKLRWQKSESI